MPTVANNNLVAATLTPGSIESLLSPNAISDDQPISGGVNIGLGSSAGVPLTITNAPTGAPAITGSTPTATTTGSTPAPNTQFYEKKWFKISAVVALVAGIAAALYYFTKKK